jgi:hypothetical protein
MIKASVLLNTRDQEGEVKGRGDKMPLFFPTKSPQNDIVSFYSINGRGGRRRRRLTHPSTSN